jgi:hypothetical protein
VTSPQSEFPPATDDGWGGDGDDTTSGRRRRARGEQGFLRELDAENVADREDVVAVAVAPVSRKVSLAIAIFAGLLGLALVLGAQTDHRAYGVVIFGVQILFVLSWTVASRPPGPGVVASVGLICAGAADLGVALPVHSTLAPLAYVTFAGVVLGTVGQLLRRTGRDHVTESLASTLTMVVGVVAYASLIVLARNTLGAQSIVACIGAATTGIVVARIFDVLMPFPRTTPQVARGTIGIIAGAMAGTVASAVLAGAIKGLQPSHAVIAGLVTAVAAVLADLGVGYAEASREIEGTVSSLWVVRHMQGPLAAFALAAPVAYAMSVMVLVPSLS